VRGLGIIVSLRSSFMTEMSLAILPKIFFE
jgi:hypothetical protein